METGLHPRPLQSTPVLNRRGKAYVHISYVICKCSSICTSCLTISQLFLIEVDEANTDSAPGGNVWCAKASLVKDIIFTVLHHSLINIAQGFLQLRVLMLPLLMEALFWATDVLYKRKREQLRARHGFLSALSFCINLLSAKAAGFSSTAQTADLKCLSGAFHRGQSLFTSVYGV